MHNKYYYQCNYHFVPNQVKNDLLEIVKTSENFKENISSKGTFDGNSIMPVPFKFFPSIAKMVESCQFKTAALLYKHMPYVSVPKHTDGLRFKIPRRTTVITPLSPKKNYPPTYFWESYESEHPADVVHVDENMFPYVITTQEVHSLVNTSDEIRANLQFSFDEPLEQIVEHIKNKTLFKDFLFEP